MSKVISCPRCGTMNLEILKTHDYCCECNYSHEYTKKSKKIFKRPAPIIPDWVLKHLDLTEADRAEIRDINLGKYAPGYELVVDTTKRPKVIEAVKKKLQGNVSDAGASSPDHSRRKSESVF